MKMGLIVAPASRSILLIRSHAWRDFSRASRLASKGRTRVNRRKINVAAKPIWSPTGEAQHLRLTA